MAKYVFGIDLGTTYSAIAYQDDTGHPVIVKNLDYNTSMIPSVVQFPEGASPVVGQAAKDESVMSPDETVTLVKQLIGKTTEAHRDPEGNVLSPAEVSSYILRGLAQQAKEELGEEALDVVITCPAYFGESERTATKQAGEIAGLNVLKIIEEPTAAAIYYGLAKAESGKTVLVYDLGGGTFDISAVRVEDGEIRSITTEGDHSLGGKDWDGALQAFIAERFVEDFGADEELYDDPDFMQDLAIKAEQIKILLTSKQEAGKPFQFGGARGAVKVTRDEFEEITSSLLLQTIDLTKKAFATLNDQGIEVDDILLVGGSTKMPQVKEALTKEFGMEPKIFEPDEAVAKGAAIFSVLMKQEENEKVEVLETEVDEVTGDKVETVKDKETGEVTRRFALESAAPAATAALKVIPVTTKSFGIRVLDSESNESKIVNLIIKDMEIPTSVTQTFYTAETNQASVSIEVYETPEKVDMYDVDEDYHLGQAVLELPANTPQNSPIEVTMQLETDGTVTVIGKNPDTNEEIKGVFQSDSVLKEEEVEAAKSRVTSTELRM